MTPGKAFHGASDVTVIGITGFLFTCTLSPAQGHKGSRDTYLYPGYFTEWIIPCYYPGDT